MPADGADVRRFVFQTLREYGIDVDLNVHDRDVLTFGEPKEGVLEFVAELDRRPVGSVIITPRGDGSAILSKFYVDAACRGRGIGRPLLDFAVQAARAAGLRQLAPDTRHVLPDTIQPSSSPGRAHAPSPPTAPRRRPY